MKPLTSHWSNRNPRKVWCLKASAPQWLKDATYEAHAGMLPNDWVHAECYAACAAIDDGALTEDTVSEHADGSVEVYTKDAATWYADMCLTSLFCNAEEEAGDAEGTISERLTRIQYYALYTIASTIVQAHEASK